MVMMMMISVAILDSAAEYNIYTGSGYCMYAGILHAHLAIDFFFCRKETRFHPFVNNGVANLWWPRYYKIAGTFDVIWYLPQLEGG